MIFKQTRDIGVINNKYTRYRCDKQHTHTHTRDVGMINNTRTHTHTHTHT